MDDRAADRLGREGVGHTVDALGRADHQKPPGVQGLVEGLAQAAAVGVFQVDQEVPAEDEVERPQVREWSDEVGDGIVTEKKPTNFQLTPVQMALSQTTVIEKPQRLRDRASNSPEFPFSITVLECVFSNHPLADGFREGKTRSNRVIRPSSLLFSPLL